MFAELEKVMASSLESDNFLESIRNNVTGKRSKSGVEHTSRYLLQLYKFNMADASFMAFTYFWKITDATERPLLAFVYAVYHDDLLAECLPVMQQTKTGEKAAVKLFEELVDKNHPNQYSANTKKSMAQNLASSWKQAGFIEGKIKNIRVQPKINYQVACFAFLLAYLKGDRGDFIWSSIGVKALLLTETQLRELAGECAKRDMMQYHYAGSVTAIGFNKLLNKIGIDVIKN